jgi:sensor histidine kinase YesM
MNLKLEGNKWVKPVSRILGFMLLLAFLGNAFVFLMFPSSEFKWENIWSYSFNSVTVGGCFAVGITWIVNYLDKKMPWLKNPGKRLLYQVIYTIGFTLLVVSITLLVIKIIWGDKIHSDFIFSQGFMMIKISLGFLLLSMLISNAIIFFVNWKKSVVAQEQLKREQLNLQYEALKNQVNPHFLFNSLNSVTSLIKKDPDKAIEFVKKLSDVFRYVLEQKENEITTLDSELAFLDSYIFLQKIRFGENLQVSIDAPVRNAFIIPLSLQMLMENAIKHNVVSKEFPLRVDIFMIDENYLVVKNSLRKKEVLDSSGIGLENIKARIGFFTSLPMKITETHDDFIVEMPVVKKF